MKPIDLALLRDIAEKTSTAFCAPAIVGGGAVRDVILGGPVKDIDVFVQCDCEEFRASAFYLAALLGGSVTQTGQSRAAYADSIIDIEIPGLPPVQCIWLDRDPVADVYEYDFDISRVFMSSAGLFTTHDHGFAKATQRITYMGDDDTPLDARLRSADRLDRLKAKYPDWAFVNTEVLDSARLEQTMIDAVALLDGLC